MLKIYDSRSRQKVEFEPFDTEGRQVGMYYCGPTVYDSVHLGHARAAIVPDMIRRYLEYRGFTVRWVANFTDVDDKIIQRALDEKRDWRELTAYYMEEYARLTAALGNRPPDARPRATDTVPEMIDLVERLLDAGNGYVAADGDVYFDVASFDGYGGLSGRRAEDQEAGRSGRLDAKRQSVKKNPGDFVLWKVATNDPEAWRSAADSLPGWPSPWGYGRPGWHLECSAISKRYLGMPFDIHGGGKDLLFPHHENEAAQNDCGYCAELAGTASVKYWVHNAFVDLDGEKMSKSLGNVKWLREMIWPEGGYDPLAIRMVMLQSHYRSPLSVVPEQLDAAAARVDKIYAVAAMLGDGLERLVPDDEGEPSETVLEAMASARAAFEKGMDDDFNTAVGLAAVDELVTYCNRELQGAAPADRRAARATLRSLVQTLGLRTEQVGGAGASDAEDGLLELLADLRGQARAAKDFATADRIRDGLSALGYELRDAQGGGTEIVRK
ncbi:MAG: cysteine--tRNA ligase [Acidobacteriota bacterium]